MIPENLLPFDGTVLYYGPVVPAAEADVYLDRLLTTIAWKPDEAVIFGRHIFTKRKVAWYGDVAFKYTYSKISREALPWTPDLLALRAIAQDCTGHKFNSCLLNLYHDGQEGMAWYCDEERELIKNGAIASMSFGAERKFLFKHKKSGDKVEVYLQHGSLLVMKDTTQSHWLHRLPPSKKITAPRVNLTFRTMVL